MQLKLAHTILLSNDVAMSKKFYCECLGLKITHDFDVCFLVEDDYLMVHDSRLFSKNVYKNELPQYTKKQGSGNVDMYFETDDLEAYFERVSSFGYEIIHPIENQFWNQLVFRVLDPDGHIVEVGEKLWKTFEPK